MEQFLNGLNYARKERTQGGGNAFSSEEQKRFHQRYEEFVASGYQENRNTSGILAKKGEKTLLNRLVKYQRNHLLFLSNFRVPYSNNRSEKDLRICKNRKKMAGGFRKEYGREMYCRILNFIETVKRRGWNLYHSIKALLAEEPMIS